MSRVRVAIIAGGRSSEHDVSLRSAAAVRAALDHWRDGKAPPISVQELVPVVRLIDRAYELAA